MKTIPTVSLKTLLLICFISFFACNEPMGVTARPNQQDATSGTLGSARSTNQLPPADTSHRVSDSTKPKKN